MPVDMSVPNSILSALIAGQRQKFQREQSQVRNEQQQQRIDEQKRQHDMMQKQFDAQLKQASEQFKASQSLRQAQYDLGIATTKAQLANAMGGIATEDEAPENVKTVNVGGPIGEIRTITPEAQAARKKPILQMQADVNTNAAVDRAKRTAEAVQPFKLGQIKEQAGATLANMQAMQKMKTEDQRELAQLEAKLWKDKQAYALGLKHRYKLLEKNTLDADSVNLSLKDIAAGNRTMEDLGKMMPIAQRAIIEKQATAAGLTIPRDTDRNNFRGMSVVAGMLNDLDRMNEALKKGNLNEYDEISNAFDVFSTNFARTAASERGNTSNADIERIKAAKPSKFNQYGKRLFTKENPNDLRIKEVKSYMQNKQDSFLKGFSPAQQHNFVQTYNLLSPYDEDK